VIRRLVVRAYGREVSASGLTDDPSRVGYDEEGCGSGCGGGVGGCRGGAGSFDDGSEFGDGGVGAVDGIYVEALAFCEAGDCADGYSFRLYLQ